jgi:hypothetical protein
MRTFRPLAFLALASAALAACDMNFAQVCADLTDCETCAETAACQWAGTKCEPIEERAPGMAGAPIIDKAFCPGAEPEACFADGRGSPCATGKCLGGICVREVTGNVQVRYWKPNQTQELVPAGAGYTVSAHATAPGWNWRWDTSAPVDPVTGAYRLHVPVGPDPGTIVLHGDDWVHGVVATTAIATQNFVWDVAGRPDEILAPEPTSVVLTATGLQSWNPSTDQFGLTTSGGYVGALASGLSGATSISFSFPISGWPLHTPASGDWAYAYQRVNRGSSPWYYLATARAAAVSTAFTGTPYSQSIPVPLGTPTSATIAFDWRFSEMSSYLSFMGPSASTYDFTGTVRMHPYTLATEVMPPTELLRMFILSGPANTVVGSLTYGRLPLSSANDVTSAEMTVRIPKQAPGAISPTNALAFLRREAAVTATVATSPVLGPVRSVLFEDNASAFTQRGGIGTTPLLKWTAPALGTPNGYVVRVLRLDNEGGSTQIRFVGAFTTTATSLRLPPGILEAGKWYFAAIDARQGAGSLIADPLRELGWPRYTSRVVTANFSP